MKLSSKEIFLLQKKGFLNVISYLVFKSPFPKITKLLERVCIPPNICAMPANSITQH